MGHLYHGSSMILESTVIVALKIWIGLREHLQEKPWFLPLNMGVCCKFSLKPFFEISSIVIFLGLEVS